jgi:hypothetical protein
MLSPEQATALATAINADPAFAGLPHNSDGAYAIADAFNLPASPAWTVWKTDVSVDEIMRNGMDWARVDNLSVGKARIWDWLSKLNQFDSSKPNIRAGIDAAWVGTSADLAVRAAIYVHCKRFATRAEKLFSTGTGTDAVPATMGYEQALTYNDVKEAMGW